MKKMIVLTSLWSFLFIFSFSMLGLRGDEDGFWTKTPTGK